MHADHGGLQEPSTSRCSPTASSSDSPPDHLLYATGDRDVIRHEIGNAGVALHIWPLDLDTLAARLVE